MTASAVSRSLRRLHRDQRGAAAVIVAISLPLLFGFGALSTNSGLWFTIKRQNQSAADAAAISGAYELIANPGFTCPGSTPANVSAAVSEAASRNGWTNTGTAPAVDPCYSDAFVSSGLEVKLWQDQSSLFAYAPLSSATIATRAVATITTLNNPCLLALNPTVGDAINLQGSVTVNAPGCSVVANSTNSHAIHIQGSASITAQTLVTPGGISYTGNAFTLSANPLIGTAGSAVPDPFQTTPTHADLIAGMPVPCAAPPPLPGGGATINYSANSKFCGGLRVQNATVNLAPGVYWITDDDLDIQSQGQVTCTACTAGAGVTVILTAGSATGQIGTVSMNANSDMTLTAPATGTFAGMLIMQDKASGGVTYTTGSNPSVGSASFQGGPSGNIAGLIYLPHEDVLFRGNPNSSCSLIIADTIQLQGNPTFTLTGCPITLTNKVTVKTVQLVQ